MAVIIYWSGTGNTEEIANRIGSDIGAKVISVLNAKIEDVKENETILFGCPAMGSEEIEDSEFRPFFESVSHELAGKNLLLFGSYGWGDGEWLRNFKDECESLGATVLSTLAVMGGESSIEDSEYDSFISKI